MTSEQYHDLGNDEHIPNEQSPNGINYDDHFLHGVPPVAENEQGQLGKDILVKLTSSEMASLWTQYMNDSMAVCMLTFFAQKCEDPSIQSILDETLTTWQTQLQKVAEILAKDGHAIPQGFGSQDVYTSAPPLYSDTFSLIYVLNMGKVGLATYGLALAISARADVADHYTECVRNASTISNQARNLLRHKGLFIRSPYIPIPTQVEFVQKQSFLNGYLGKRRPLNAVEISHIYSSIETNALAKSLLMGFSQVAESNQVRKYMRRGKEITSKNIEVFRQLLNNEDLSAPMTWDAEVLDSTVAPFSDKLMMFHVGVLGSVGASNYGAAIGVSHRRDLGVAYARLMTENVQYAEDGANILIDNAWMEQPPLAADREQLSR